MKTIGMLLWTLLVLPGSTDYRTKQARPLVLISVTGIRRFHNTGHHPENDRRVTFRLLNQSVKPLIIYGLKYDERFDPTGYMMIFDRDRGEWVYPTNDNHPAKWSEVSKELKDSLFLEPGKSVSFTAEMSHVEAGERFRRTVYIAQDKGQEPMEVISEEFILR